MIGVRSLLANLTYVGGGEIIARIAHLGTFALCTRYLGPVGFGIYGTAWAIYSMALPFVQSAPELLGIRTLARTEMPTPIVGEITTLKFVMATAAMIILAAFAIIMYGIHSSNFEQLVLQSIVLFGIAINPAWAARAMRRFDIHAWNRICQALSMTVLTFLLLNYSADPVVVALAEISSYVFAFVILIATPTFLNTSTQAVALVPRHLGDVIVAVKNHFHPALQIGISGLASTIKLLACIPIAEYFLAAEEAGFVSAVLRLLVFVLSQFQIALQIFYPRLAQYYSEDIDRARELAANLFAYTFVVAALATLLMIFFAEPIVLLTMGSAYLPIVPVLQILAPTLLTIGAGSVFGYIMLADGKTGAYLTFNLIGAIALVACGLISFSAMQSPLATGALMIISLLQAIAAAIYCFHQRLIGRRPFSRYRFRWPYISDFLKSQ